MKISKLFHWLYASLMVLPLVFVAPTALYYSFNQSAIPVSSEKITIEEDGYYVDDGNGELISGNIFNPESYSDDSFILGSFSSSFYFSFRVKPLPLSNTSGCQIYIRNSASETACTFDVDSISGQTFSCGSFVDVTHNWEEGEYRVDFDGSVCTISDILVVPDASNGVIYPYTPYGARPIVTTETQTSTFPDVMTQAVDSTFNQPIFKWAKSSFFVQPFSFINNVFGMSNDNPLNYFLSYWFSISVCWLVFDVMMYVPNLVHRWLDKGALD